MNPKKCTEYTENKVSASDPGCSVIICKSASMPSGKDYWQDPSYV